MMLPAWSSLGIWSAHVVSPLGKEQMDDIPFLPLEIIFRILLCLPAEFLYNSVRYVCKAWADIICDPSFINAHLLKSKSGLLIQECSQSCRAHFLDMEDGNFRSTSLKCTLPGMAMDSCRGVCLFCCKYGKFWKGRKSQYGYRLLYVVNPATMQIQQLPSLGDGSYECSNLAYIDDLGEYKVVCLFSNYENYDWFVFTLGVDKAWRKLNSMPKNILAVWSSVTVGHLVYLSQRTESSSIIVAIDLCKETACSIQFPYSIIRHRFGLFRMGDYLACFIYQSKEVNIWMLKDLEKCEWVKVCSIERVIARNRLHSHLWSRVGWLDDSQIFVSQLCVLIQRTSFMAFNAETGITKAFTLSSEYPCYNFLLHTNSLIKW